MTDLATLRFLEERLLDSSVRKDKAAVSNLLAEEFQEFGSSGRIYNKAEILAELATEFPRYIHLRDFHCCFPAADIALITYRTESQTNTALRS